MCRHSSRSLGGGDPNNAVAKIFHREVTHELKRLAIRGSHRNVREPHDCELISHLRDAASARGGSGCAATPMEARRVPV
jgi:hypothetical protein